MSSPKSRLPLGIVDAAPHYQAPEDISLGEWAWMRHSLAITKLWNPPDSEEVAQQYGAACGLMAFAAVTGAFASAAIPMFPRLKDRRWINRREMQAALQQIGFTCTNVPNRQWPNVGLCLIHFTGPWTNSGYPARILPHTHWIGVVGEYVFDINWSGWLPRQNWHDVVLEQLLLSRPYANGWSVLSSYQLCKSESLEA